MARFNNKENKTILNRSYLKQQFKTKKLPFCKKKPHHKQRHTKEVNKTAEYVSTITGFKTTLIRMIYDYFDNFTPKSVLKI